MTSVPLRARLALALGVLALGACDGDRLTAPPAPAPSRAVAGASSGALVPPALPRATVDTDPVAPTGRTITVAPGSSLQSAIAAAVPGDVIVLTAGGRYTGNFYLPKKSGTGWVTIRTSTPDSRLPAPGTRITPAQAGLLPKLVSPNGSAALWTSAGAHHYRIVGLEITAGSAVTTSTQLVAIGSGSTSSQKTLASVPHHIVLDRSYVHGHATLNLKNCVELHGADVAIVDSYLSQCHSKIQESHAIIGWNGPGPVRIENNYIAGAGINIMFGGASPASAALLPSDITIRRNHVTKPTSWKGVWPVKTLVELKIGRRILIEGNVFENSWVDQQRGFAFVFKTAVSAAASAFGRTEDVTLRQNLVRNAAGGISLSARDGSYGLPARRVRLEHNVWDGIGAANGTTNGRIFEVLSGVHGVQIEHNTAIHSSVHADALVRFGSGVDSGFVFRDNVTSRGTGVQGDRVTEGTPALNRYAPAHAFSGNVLAAASSGYYPAGNHFPAALAGVGFVSLSGRDYRLAGTSPYRGRASDGTDPGADVAAVAALTAGVVR